MRYARAQGIDETRAGDDIFLVHPKSQEILHLNPLGTAIWRSLREPLEMEDILASLAEVFPSVPRSRLEEDARAFFEEMSAHALVEIRNDP